MIIDEIYKGEDDFTIDKYLTWCGVTDVKKFKCPTEADCVESFSEYFNIYSATALLDEIIENPDKQTYIVQDPDVDGLMSSFIIYKYLLGYGVKAKMLMHHTKSHNLDDQIISQIGDECSYLIVPDAGSNDIEQLKILNDRGIKVLIADHHRVEHINEIPSNVVLVNSSIQRLDNPYMSGTGVMWKVMCAREKATLYEYIPYVAFANLSDVMCISSLENRYLDYYLEWHIKKLGEDFNVFFSVLNEELNKNDLMTPKNIVWNITPKLNAVIRSFDIDILRKLFAGLLNNNKDYIKQIIPDLTKAYRKQRETTKDMYEQILPVAEGKSYIIGKTIKSAYTGMLAGKMNSEYNKTALLVYEVGNNYVGSCRSLMKVRSLFEKSGLFNFASGHEEAFGISFPKSNLGKIQVFLSNMQEQPIRVVKSLDPYSFHLDKYADELTVWGKGIAKPLYHVHIENFDMSNIQVVGKSGTTIKFRYGNMEFIKFFVSKEAQKVFDKDRANLDIIGNLEYNHWNNMKTLQMVIDKIEVNECAPKRLEDLF